MHPLDTLLALEIESTAFGLSYPNVEMILDQIKDECLEIQETLHQGEGKVRLQEEVGDLVHAALSLCLFLELDMEETLSKANTKFASRLKHVKAVAQSLGLSSLKGQSPEALTAIWNQAKSLEAV